MRMEMQYYNVRRLQFGRETRYADGVLTICKEQLLTALPCKDAFQRIDLHIAGPGEPVRISNILEISAPRVKSGRADSGSADYGNADSRYYPGMLCPPYRAGEGKTNMLRNCTVMEVGHMPGMYGGVVDMQGAAADLTPFSKTFNLCLVTEPRPDAEKIEYGIALKKAALKVAVVLAETTLGQPPDDVDVFDLSATPLPDKQLPRVGYLFQMCSSGRLREPLIYGARYHHFYPTLLHPNEILDGALICGNYEASFVLRNPTHTIINHPVIMDLYERHGREIDFRGVVIAPEPTTLEEIRRTAMMSAGLLKYGLQSDGVIMTKEGGGHTTVDLMECCDACEDIGIRTVLIDNEWLGPEGACDLSVLSMSPNADAMINIGNIEEVVHLEPVEDVIGGYHIIEVAEDLRNGGSIPIRCIPEAISQLGAGALTARYCNGGREVKRNIDCGVPAARRASDMLLEKMAGQPLKTEITKD